MKILLLLLAAVYVLETEQNSIVRINFFEKPGYKGEKYSVISNGACKNIDDEWHQRVRSIFPKNQYVVLFAEPNCKGGKIEVEAGSQLHTNLVAVGKENSTTPVTPQVKSFHITKEITGPAAEA